MRYLVRFAIPFLLLTTTVLPAAELKLAVTGGDADMTDVPLSAEITLPDSVAALKPDQVKVRLKDGDEVPGQVVSDGGKIRLWWVAPAVKAGSTTTWTAAFSKRDKPCGACFHFKKDEEAKHLDLTCGDTLVTRYVYVRDTADKETMFNTSKCFHHVFSPKRAEPITKGPGGKYSHHRGIFIGWSRLGFKGNKYDLWHCRKGEVIRHREFATLAAGPVLARTTCLLDWKTADDGEVILAEERTATVYRQPDPTILLMDFTSTVTAVTDDVELNGDPEHAGCQFRPSNEIAGKCEGGDRQATYLYCSKEVNAKNCKKQQGMPWTAMNYALDGQDYSVIHMNHEDNPDNAVYSAYRPYGRFGCWTRHALKKGESLTLKYRFMVIADTLPARDACAALREAFVDPPEVAVK